MIELPISEYEEGGDLPDFLDDEFEWDPDLD